MECAADSSSSQDEQMLKELDRRDGIYSFIFHELEAPKFEPPIWEIPMEPPSPLLAEPQEHLQFKTEMPDEACDCDSCRARDQLDSPLFPIVSSPSPTPSTPSPPPLGPFPTFTPISQQLFPRFAMTTTGGTLPSLISALPPTVITKAPSATITRPMSLFPRATLGETIGTLPNNIIVTAPRATHTIATTTMPRDTLPFQHIKVSSALGAPPNRTSNFPTTLIVSPTATSMVTSNATITSNANAAGGMGASVDFKPWPYSMVRKNDYWETLQSPPSLVYDPLEFHDYLAKRELELLPDPPSFSHRYAPMVRNRSHPLKQTEAYKRYGMNMRGKIPDLRELFPKDPDVHAPFRSQHFNSILLWK